jgi:hypothetical protein
VAHGIPRGQVAAVGDADGDAKKQALFERVRQGTVRVLLGSTQKMGTGTNVQRRLCALHHLDAPWKPAEVEQREGRILRQGNENAEVSIFRYVTAGSFDAYMWQALETKARFIGQVMTGESGVRKAEDIGGQELSYAEVKAIASGNPAVLTLAEADAELQRLFTLRKHHADEQFLARRNVRELPEAIARLRARLDELEADGETARAHADEPVTIGGVTCPRDRLLPALGARLDVLPEEVRETSRFVLGRMRGLAFGVVKHRFGPPEVFLEGRGLRQTPLARDSQGPRACLNAAERLFTSYGPQSDEVRRELALTEVKLRDFGARLGAMFPHERYIEDLSALRDELRLALSATPQEGIGPKTRTSDELSGLIQALKDSHAVEAVPAKRPGAATRSERPVTGRIRARHEAEASEPAAAEEPAEGPLPPVAKAEGIGVEAGPPVSAAPEVASPVASSTLSAREPRRKRYQKWLF